MFDNGSAIAVSLFKNLATMYNKTLNITEEDILKEDSLDVLRQKRIEIEQHLSETKLNFSKYKKLTSKQKQYISSLIGLRKICRLKIKDIMDELREKGVWVSGRDIRKQMHLASIFMEEAKKRLDKEIYNELLKISQSRIENNK